MFYWNQFADQCIPVDLPIIIFLPTWKIRLPKKPFLPFLRFFPNGLKGFSEYAPAVCIIDFTWDDEFQCPKLLQLSDNMVIFEV